MGCGNSKLKKQLKAELSNKFDNFDFRINASDVFTFTDRAKRELTGGCAPGDYMERLFNAYRDFIIDASVNILVSHTKPENGKFTVKISPGPLIDEMWCLAILYSEKYKELCETLVGGVIDRAPSTKSRNTTYCKKMWPDYQSSFLELDQKYVVWIYNKDIGYFLNFFYDQIKASASNNVIKIHKKTVEDELKKLQASLTYKYTGVDMNKFQSPIPGSHSYYNPDVKDNPNEVYQKIIS